MDFTFKERYTINDLLLIVKLLRGDGGCPWDKEQTHESIRKNFIEETYEVCEAIDNKDAMLLKEELGDVLLQVALHSQMEQENDVFSFDDVANDICQKLIIRHPHVFSDNNAKTVDEILSNWAKIKQNTKGQTTASQTLYSVPKQLPALMRSDKVQGRAKKANPKAFTAINKQDILSHVNGEINELKKAIENDDKQNIAEEIGDIMFAMVNVARHFHMDSEELLTQSTDKFIKRFSKVEELAKSNGINFENAYEEEIDILWKQAKISD